MARTPSKTRKTTGVTGYAAYKQLYREKAKQLAAKGRTMDDHMLKKSEWEVYKIAAQNQRKAEGLKGPGNINRDLVNRQAYKYSYAQARANQRAIKAYNEEIRQYNLTAPPGQKKQLIKANINQLRSGEYDMTFLKQIYHELRDSGMSVDQTMEEIHNRFYGGSPK